MSDPMMDVDVRQPLTKSGLFTLSHTEQRLFDLLMDICKTHNLTTTLRVAGGWVRDKVRRFAFLNNSRQLETRRLWSSPIFQQLPASQSCYNTWY
jgi:tRNA nucleotidyltransferase (CCA-adding enzyme)